MAMAQYLISQKPYYRIFVTFLFMTRIDVINTVFTIWSEKVNVKVLIDVASKRLSESVLVAGGWLSMLITNRKVKSSFCLAISNQITAYALMIKQ